MRIGVLALQGAFLEQERMLEELGASCIELRKSGDLLQEFDGIVLPGGESSVQGKLLKELSMFEGLKKLLDEGIPALGTCAGLILLAEAIEGSKERWFGTLPVTVRRNAYGRQLGSFSEQTVIRGISEEEKPFPLKFIRAPFISGIKGRRSEQGELSRQKSFSGTNDQVRPIAVLHKMPDGSAGQNIVGVRYKNQIGLAFHPELTKDLRCHELFLSMCGNAARII